MHKGTILHFNLQWLFFRNRVGGATLITSRHVEIFLQKKARSVYNITKKEQLWRFTSHSIRLGACMLLHKNNCTSEFIKVRLQWRSDAFLTYLRKIIKFASLHNMASNNSELNLLHLKTKTKIAFSLLQCSVLICQRIFDENNMFGFCEIDVAFYVIFLFSHCSDLWPIVCMMSNVVTLGVCVWHHTFVRCAGITVHHSVRESGQHAVHVVLKLRFIFCKLHI